MRALVAFLLFTLAVVQALDVKTEWNNYKAQFNKNYASVEEDEFRFKIFAENKQKIEEHNAKYEKGEVSHKLGLNKFSDWTAEEFKKIQGTRPRANNVMTAFNDWRAKFNKKYDTIDEVVFRFKIFMETKKEVDKHNAKYEKGEVSWKKSLNQFSDRTQSEFKEYLGLWRPGANQKIQKAWKEYKAKYNKNYASVEEDEYRFKIFAVNKERVAEHNAKYARGEVTWEMSLNEFSDLAPEELREQLGYKPKQH